MIAVNGRFLRQRVTGVQRYARELTRRLGPQVRLVAPGVAAEGLPGHLWEQAVLPARLSRRDLLWSPANTGPLAVARQVVTIHDLAAVEHPEWFSGAFARWYAIFWPRLVRRVEAVLTVSEFSKGRLVERFGLPPERVRVVPNGVDERFAPQEEEAIQTVRRRLGLPEAYVLMVASHDPRKNLARVLQAWRSIQKAYEGVELVVAGAAHRAFRVPQASEPGPANSLSRVRFIGYVDDADLPALYAGARLFVYPSLYEGFGLPVLEAMACGVPVVTSATGPMPEVAGDAAILVDPHDPEAIADAVRRLLDSAQLRSALGSKGVARARLFTWDKAAAELRRALDELAGA
ncbi:glycosyltransferase family 1 protein [Carboxydochorda subterranea]|uniref:Glycosyltransferase family 1 protein n=1 Tax=Carboxydichorda subterranea TaxID=3109565 RepID=A0ABZ1BTS4_9FIRM|nr:glycosyltransferase family 1 protein [Limnochorda sp. L945t]WRP16041.1 glycosyltransferase family 1 protein [Limnochorda sp. L945t]